MSSSSLAKKRRKRRRRLKDIDVSAVSLVDVPANQRRFLLLKNQGEDDMDDEVTLDAEELEFFDEEILKAIDPKAAKIIGSFVNRISRYMDSLPKGLQGAINRLKSAAGGGEPAGGGGGTGYPPPDKKGVKKDMAENQEQTTEQMPEWAKRLEAQNARIEKALGIHEEQKVPLAEVEKMFGEMLKEKIESGELIVAATD